MQPSLLRDWGFDRLHVFCLRQCLLDSVSPRCPLGIYSFAQVALFCEISWMRSCLKSTLSKRVGGKLLLKGKDERFIHDGNGVEFISKARNLRHQQ
ncbi:hypothetical protein DITRI_Ditri15bG0109200 [Diplodiscus trichospermus]